MKPIILFAFILLATFSQSQSAIVWSPPIEVTGSTDAHRPRIDLLADNSPVLIWSQFSGSSDKDYFFSKWDGNNFLAPIILNDQTILSYDWGGTEIVADGNTLYTVYKTGDITVGKVYIRRSLDGGLTWEPKIQIEETGELAMYPGIEAYNDSNVLITYMTHGPGGSNPQYIVRSSTDGGQTFTSTVASVSEDFGEEACYCCPPAIVGNSDYQVMSFRNDENNIRDMKAGVSTDGGLTFDTQISLDDHDWWMASCPATGGDLVLNGSKLYSTYMSRGEGDEMIYLVEDDLADSLVYTEAQTIVDFPTTTSMNHPHLANIGDTVIVVWELNSMGENDIWFNYSFDGLNNWTTATASPVFELPGAQLKPDVEIGTDGSIHLVYHDSDLDKVMYTKGFFSSVGLTEAHLASFNVHPNPVSDILTLEGIGSQEVYTILDIQGTTITQGAGNEVDVQELSSGLYFIRIDGYQQQKFVVK